MHPGHGQLRSPNSPWPDLNSMDFPASWTLGSLPELTCDLITSPGPHLPSLSHWGLKCSTGLGYKPPSTAPCNPDVTFELTFVFTPQGGQPHPSYRYGHGGSHVTRAELAS